jgi:hypothetical protein
MANFVCGAEAFWARAVVASGFGAEAYDAADLREEK